ESRREAGEQEAMAREDRASHLENDAFALQLAEMVERRRQLQWLAASVGSRLGGNGSGGLSFADSGSGGRGGIVTASLDDIIYVSSDESDLGEADVAFAVRMGIPLAGLEGTDRDGDSAGDSDGDGDENNDSGRDSGSEDRTGSGDSGGGEDGEDGEGDRANSGIVRRRDRESRDGQERSSGDRNAGGGGGDGASVKSYEEGPPVASDPEQAFLEPPPPDGSRTSGADKAVSFSANEGRTGDQTSQPDMDGGGGGNLGNGGDCGGGGGGLKPAGRHSASVAARDSTSRSSKVRKAWMRGSAGSGGSRGS
ncbi:unnamed protein product, partial [Phaeothamnion confervicola]